MRADDWPFATAAEREDYERVERLYGALAATVDPDDPWSHPDASLLDGARSATGCARSMRSPAVIRCLATGALALADGSIEYISLLSELASRRRRRRRASTATSAGSRSRSAREAPRWQSGWRGARGTHPARAVVEAVSVSAAGCSVRLAGGETLAGGAVVCALPVGVLRTS